MATQILARNLHPHRCNSTSSRYDEDEVMAYTVDGQNGEPEKEDAGVLHLAHGWIQRGQKNKVSQKIIDIQYIFIIDIGSIHLQRYYSIRHCYRLNKSLLSRH